MPQIYDMGPTALGRIISMKNSKDIIGNRTRYLPACSAVPQPTAPPAACPKACFTSWQTGERR